MHCWYCCNCGFQNDFFKTHLFSNVGINLWEMGKISLLALGNNSSVGLAMQIDMVLKKTTAASKNKHYVFTSDTFLQRFLKDLQTKL